MPDALVTVFLIGADGGTVPFKVGRSEPGEKQLSVEVSPDSNRPLLVRVESQGRPTRPPARDVNPDLADLVCAAEAPSVRREAPTFARELVLRFSGGGAAFRVTGELALDANFRYRGRFEHTFEPAFLAAHRADRPGRHHWPGRWVRPNLLAREASWTRFTFVAAGARDPPAKALVPLAMYQMQGRDVVR